MLARDNLNTALQIVKTFEDKATMPILSHVLIEAKGPEMFFTVTDLESAIRFKTYLTHLVDNDWKRCVPVKKLAELIKERGGYPFLAPSEDYKLKIETAEGEVEITGMVPSDFPEWSRPDNKEHVNLPVDTFLDLEGLPKTASRDDSRYMLDMVNFQCKHYGEGKAITCDGHRINTVKTRWLPETWNFMISAQALRKTIGAIKKLRRQMSEVELFRSEKGLTIIAGPMEIWLRFTEGEYPDTSKFEANGPTAQVKTSDMRQALLRVGCIFREGKAKSGVPKTAQGTFHFLAHGVEMWSQTRDKDATAFTFVDGQVDPELVGKLKTFNLDYVNQAVNKSNGTVRIVSNTEERGVWQFGPEMVMPMTEDIDRPDVAPAACIVKQLAEPVRALPVDNWRTDPTADPGPGFEWEPESDYFPAHWARVA